MVAMMTETAAFSQQGDVLALQGRLTLAQLGDLPQQLANLSAPLRSIDLSAVARLDTIGALVVHQLATQHAATVTGASADNARLIAQIAALDAPMDMRRTPINPVVRLIADMGHGITEAWHLALGLVAFFGGIMVALYNVLRAPTRFRWHAFVHAAEDVGVKALVIIGLMSFLVGIVIAQQGAFQLQDSGLSILTVNLVGRLSLRELGLLMTAIMVAGRSGSAFAAQIGTMKLTEEVDAMRTIGVAPMEALVLPRVLVSVTVLPLLGFYASIFAIIGGGVFCWADLGITPTVFVEKLRSVVPLSDLYVMLIKAPVFGLIIGMTGCFQGLLVEADAEQVGRRTTAAVVQAIFIVITLDAFFAVFFTQIGWG